MVLGFSVVIPTTGYSGWTALQKTAERQKAALQKSPIIKRELEYFKANIAKADTPEKLMKDYRLLSFVMTAYRLDDSLSYKAMITKSISQPTTDSASLVNKLSDKRWYQLGVTLGYGDKEGGNVGTTTFQDQIVKKYLQTQWETAVGESDSDMETALYVQERLTALAKETNVDKSGWYSIISEAPLRDMFQTAFGFPSSFVNLDVDKQVQMYKAAAKKMFGSDTLSQFADEKKNTTLIRRFFALKAVQNGVNTASNPALSILAGSGLAQSLFSIKTG